MARLTKQGDQMKAPASLFLGIFALTATATSASSAELKVFTVRAISTVLDVVGPQFQKTSAHKLNIVTGFTPELLKRIKAGESYDILVVPAPVIDRLIKDGTLRADSRVLLTHADAGVEVRAGAPKPDISSVAAFKRTLVNAKSVTYLPVPGIPQMLQRIGIADAIKDKTTIPKTDVASELVAKGDVELGIVVITQILTTPGVELVGPLPPEIKVTTTFAGAISANSKAPEAARDLLKFLHNDESVTVIRKQGMEPAL